jgi:pseudouridine synthase
MLRGKQYRGFLLFAAIVAQTFLCLVSEALSSPEAIRLNKVFKKTHSRRQADALIASGRITVNNEPVHSAGQRVIPFQDIVCLDGKQITGWEELNHLASAEKNKQVFEYIKYWKPVGVTCTTDRRIPDNLIDTLQDDGCFPKSRIFPVGRLDKETSGLILMTSDGRLPNAALRGKYKQPKTYVVRTNRPVTIEDIQRLRDGVVITTVAQRDGNRGKPLIAPTLPCQIKTSKKNPHVLEITLVEGRNRQIRKMLDAVGYRVIDLHRKSFMRITLDPLVGPGEWTALSLEEMELVLEVMSMASEDGDEE